MPAPARENSPGVCAQFRKPRRNAGDGNAANQQQLLQVIEEQWSSLLQELAEHHTALMESVSRRHALVFQAASSLCQGKEEAVATSLTSWADALDDADPNVATPKTLSRGSAGSSKYSRGPPSCSIPSEPLVSNLPRKEGTDKSQHTSDSHPKRITNGEESKVEMPLQLPKPDGEPRLLCPAGEVPVEARTTLQSYPMAADDRTSLQSYPIPADVQALESNRASTESCAVLSMSIDRPTFAQHKVSTKRGSFDQTAGTLMRLEEVLTKKKKRAHETPKFDMAVGFAIIVNALVTAFSYQYEGYKSAYTSGLTTEDHGYKSALPVFLVFEHFFCILFTSELALRWWWHGWVHFAELLGMFELILVVMTMVELYVLDPLNVGSGNNMSILRVTRLFKLVRVMRIVRVVSLFSSLRILIKTIGSSFLSLFMSMMLLGLIVCTAGMFACQLVSDAFTDTSIELKRRNWLYTHYGTSTRAMYTIFEATLSGCWPNYARPLIDEINGLWSFFWILYVAVVVFAIIRIITAIFLKETLQNASADADTMIQEQMLKKKAYRAKLKDAFEAIDITGEGAICREDFEKILSAPKLQAYLAVLDFEVHDSAKVFSMLEEDNDGHLTYSEFLEGIMRLKGAARQIDVVALQRDCRHVMQAVISLVESMEEVHGVTIVKPSLEHMSGFFHTEDLEASVIVGEFNDM